MKDEKPKVIPLYRNDTVEILEDLLDLARNGELVNFIVAGKLKDGNIITGNANVNVIEQHTLISYLNVDVIMKTVQANYEDEEE